MLFMSSLAFFFTLSNLTLTCSIVAPILGIPLYSPIYAASEGLLGINIWPKELPSRYLLHPRAQFFEFIPDYRMDEEQPKTYLMHQVACS